MKMADRPVVPALAVDIRVEPATLASRPYEWYVCGSPNPFDRLLATIVVHGCLVHLEAIRIEPDPLMLQVAADPALEESLGAAAVICGADGPFETATIADRQYVIVATSFAQ